MIIDHKRTSERHTYIYVHNVNVMEDRLCQLARIHIFYTVVIRCADGVRWGGEGGREEREEGGMN